MSHKCIQVEITGHIMTVTLNRPEVRNALHAEASYELGRVFDDFEANPQLRVAIVTGTGDKAFCAGADLKKKASGEAQGPQVPPSGFGGLCARFDRLKPVIAAVNGFAAGGGFELALACDIILAASTARFGLTEPKVGYAALGGGIQRLIREIGLKRANALLLTGRLVTAEEGKALGFVNHVSSPAELMIEAQHWADEIMYCSPAAIGAIKEIANALDGQSVPCSMRTTPDLPAVKTLFASPDLKEGPRAFAEHRTPIWSGV